MTLPASMRLFERGWLSANNILFLGREETALVDSGYVSHAPQTLALVGHGLGGRRLDLLINTHLHSDHCGGNAALQAAHACRTLIPAAEAASVRAWDEEALSYRATGQQCPRFGFDGILGDGDVLRLGDLDWRVLAAPGHDPHALLLWCDAQGILLSADALWENGFGVIFPELEGESGFKEARATLELIAGLDARLVIPGHGAAFTDVRAALERARRRLDFLEADPVRNAQNGVKVLVKFRLLERRRVELSELRQWVREVPLLVTSNRRCLQMEDDALADWIASQLVRAGVAAIEDGMLVDQ
ncbi:MBL fold metallo-hydrolase [Noviherbaspirillum pedocola]|uniref:MBL fold metallo-hydrolase n=1 Tax=Noviherbaspirillum pedocola TaxID=2801341 RepID=A0A934T096_9BURK|nr:MBL fold metallo-hydrolase [Noviherbaspirillum pedocola]MBK4738306.1 MBL fold metallo-hydrolase [Noviherbaspirillum pedocola]